MLRWIILAVLVVVIAAAATVLVQTTPSESLAVNYPVKPAASKVEGPQPHVVVDGDLAYHFDTKPQKIKFSRDWVIKNDGKGELTLRLEAPPCSCTVANFGKDGKTTVMVPPGGQIPIHFTWETRTYTGHYRKPAIVLTNDLERPKLEFVAEGTIQPALVVYPTTDIDLMEVSTDETSHSARVALYSPDRPEMKILKLSSSKPELITLTSEPLKEEDLKHLKVKAGYRINVALKQGMPLGAFREEIVVHTDHPEQPEMTLSVSGKMVGPITLVPERLRMPNVSSSDGGQGKVTLLVRGRRETKFEVEQKPEKFKVEVVPGDNLTKVSKYEMIVTIPPGTPAGVIEDLVVLRTDHPQAPEVRIPLNLYVRDAR
jgi:hypothetical protein